MNRQVEILAPAGSWDSLIAAINAGADALYIGGSRFGARAFANNLTTEQMCEAIDYCHLHGRKLYLTVNTLLKEHELQEELYEFLKPLYEHGLDAVLVQDFGVLSWMKEHFPDLELHASTQMTLQGANGAKYLEELGVKRVVTSRELSLEEIKDIRKNISIEIESFIHGALCYCYSGQCLYSSLIGGRSGNRGRCAQPCRLEYEANGKKGFLLSPKDICTLDILPDIIEAGVFSLKIEGRMKSPEYAAGVVRVYRKYVDRYLKHGRKNYRVDEKDRQELRDLFNRGGFSEGYYKTHNGKNMLFLEGPEAAKLKNAKRAKQDNARKDALNQSLHETYTLGKLQEKINGKLMILKGKTAILTVSAGEVSVSVEGSEVLPAERQPLAMEKVRKQMEKTGNTPFVFENLEILLGEDCFMPLQSLNELRRGALEALEEKILEPYRRKAEEKVIISSKETGCGLSKKDRYPIHAVIERKDVLDGLLTIPEIEAIYADSMIADEALLQKCHTHGKKCYYAMPRVFRLDIQREFEKKLSLMEKFDGIFVRSLEEFVWLREHKCENNMILDQNFYAYNARAHEFWMSQGAEYDTLPIELNNRELGARGCEESELIVYGYLPMMVSAQCIQKTTGGCTHVPTVIRMKDRKGKYFPVKNYCPYCYNVIYNASPLVLLDNKADIDALSPKSLRLDFTVESPAETARVAKLYAQRFGQNEELEQTQDTLFEEFTRGHFKRGIE